MTTRPFDDLEVSRYALHFVSSTVDRLDDEQLGAPTPCSEWTVGDVAGHVVDVLDKAAVALCGLERAAPTQPRPTASEVRRAGRGFLIAADAVDLKERFETELGPIRGRTLVAHVSVDLLVHGWDIARGADLAMLLSLDPLVADGALAFVRRAISDDRRGRWLAPAVPVDGGATAEDRLVAFLGRSPRWSARLVSA